MDFTQAVGIIDAHAKRLEQARGIVAAHANPTAKKLGHVTWLEYDEDGCYHLRYFKTNILTFWPDHFELNDGGFFSHSTHQKLNEHMPRGFRVYGHTNPKLQLKRPLGFLRTPKGVYPYTMPLSFQYDGGPLQGEEGSALTHEAHLVHGIPAYVDRYLGLLLHNEPCTCETLEEHLNTLHPLSKSGIELTAISKQIARAIGTGTTYTFMARRMAQERGGSLGGMELHDVCQLLAERGSKVFRKPKTADERTQRLEDVLFYSKAIPDLTVPAIRSRLRQPLIEYLVDNLGFDHVEWNRRER
jgi:hypothetical protein